MASSTSEWCDHKLSCAVIYNGLKMGHTIDSVIKGKDVIPGCVKKESNGKKIKSVPVMSENRVMIPTQGMDELQYHTFLYSRDPFEN